MSSDYKTLKSCNTDKSTCTANSHTLHDKILADVFSSLLHGLFLYQKKEQLSRDHVQMHQSNPAMYTVLLYNSVDVLRPSVHIFLYSDPRRHA